MEKVFRAFDGKIFDTYDAATMYEKGKFGSWIVSNLLLDKISASLSDDKPDTFHGTEKEVFLSILHHFFEDQIIGERKN